MEQQMDVVVKEFLLNSPYSEEEKIEITLYIDGLKQNEKRDFIDLMNLTNNLTKSQQEENK
jgi:hypothetical protein